MSTFVKHQTRSILQVATHSQSSNESSNFRALPHSISSQQRKLEDLVTQLNSPLSPDVLTNTIGQLIREIEVTDAADLDEEDLEWTALCRSVVGVYSAVMDVLLKQAAQAEDEAEWWGRIERVGGGTAWYFLQTFPIRFARLSNVLLNTVKSQTQTITLETFKPGSLHRIFPPNSFTHLCGQSLFPHLTHPTELFRRNPLEITRQESRLRRIELEKLRDRRAQSLGQLAAFRGAVEDALRSERPLSERMETLQVIVELLDYSLKDTQSPDIPPFNPREAMSSARASTRTLFPRLHEILTTRLMSQGSYHRAVITPLQKPSWIVRRWPRIILGPPLAFLAFKLVFKSKDQMLSTLKEAGETIVAFWKDWVVEPIAGILETVRTGGDTGMRVVSKEGLNSDMDSLERMVLSLSAEKLGYNQAQLDELGSQIRQGDLTPVLKIYEEDIKTPLRSAITGSLVRSLLIQIQKTKVDVDLALNGIDKLLKSQELTFGFVGVAPSLVVLYAVGGWIRNTWGGGRGKGRYGGVGQREAAWVAMRRIERLLSARPSSSESPEQVTPLMQGLLILSTTHLREYALTYLPARSRLQDGFLEDVEDLQDSKGNLGREEKLRVVKRMWRNWGKILGWDTIAAEGRRLAV